MILTLAFFKQAKEKEDQWNAKVKKLQGDGQEMRWALNANFVFLLLQTS